MAGITTSMVTSFKKELFSAGHCFNPTVTPTVTAASGSTSVTAVSSLTNIAVGMAVSGTGIAAGTVVAAVVAPNSLVLSAPTTAAIAAAPITISGDVFKLALIKPAMAGSYDATTTNYSNIVADEVANGSGYTTGGQALTNVAPASDTTVAFATFAPNPSWTSATFSTAGCMIYNSSTRTAVGGRACSVHDFGGSQQVTSGTFTVLMPAATGLDAILRIA